MLALQLLPVLRGCGDGLKCVAAALFPKPRSLSTRPRSGLPPPFFFFLSFLQRHQSSSISPPSGEACWNPCHLLPAYCLPQNPPPFLNSISTLAPTVFAEHNAHGFKRTFDTHDVIETIQEVVQPLRIMGSQEQRITKASSSSSVSPSDTVQPWPPMSGTCLWL